MSSIPTIRNCFTYLTGFVYDKQGFSDPGPQDGLSFQRQTIEKVDRTDGYFSKAIFGKGVHRPSHRFGEYYRLPSSSKYYNYLFASFTAKRNVKKETIVTILNKMNKNIVFGDRYGGFLLLHDGFTGNVVIFRTDTTGVVRYWPPCYEPKFTLRNSVRWEPMLMDELVKDDVVAVIRKLITDNETDVEDTAMEMATDAILVGMETPDHLLDLWNVVPGAW